MNLIQSRSNLDQKIIEGFFNNELSVKAADYSSEEKFEEFIKIIVSILSSWRTSEIINLLSSSYSHKKVIASEVPQFSDFFDVVFKTPRAIDNSNKKDISFVEMGKLLAPNTSKVDGAHMKYGENHAKTAALLGLTTVVNGKINLSDFGKAYLNLDPYMQALIVPALCLKVPIIYNYFCGTVSENGIEDDMDEAGLSESTKGRRRSNIRAMISIVKDGIRLPEIDKDSDEKQQQLPFPNEEKEEKQIIYYGAPGTGKSFAIESATEGEDVIRTTFHPDSDYSTFVGAYKPTTKEVPVISNFGGKAIKVKDEDGNDIKEERIVYEFVNQAFLQAYVGAWEKYAEAAGQSPQKQFLVIEEINRGNCAQIFGDLFQLLDRNPQGFSEYPIKADADMKKQLKKQLAGLNIENAGTINALYKNEDVVSKVLDGDILLLPSNLFIWATMNTSDQSLFPIDSAFKRRWDWKYVPIANAGLNWAIEVKGKKYDWWDFLKKINALIGETTNSEDKKLGYFFCKTETGIIDAESFVGKVIFYLWNDVFKDFEFEGDVFVDTDGETKLTFDKFYNSNATVRESTVEVFLNNLGVIYADEVANEELTPEEDDEFIPEETEDNASFTNVNGPDTSTYSINGQGSYGKTNVPIECVRLYASMHPESTIQEIVDVWQNLGVKHVKHLVETEEAHTQRGLETKDDKFKYKAKELILPQGGKVFVSNQFNVERIASFIEKVNAQDWGIYIAKIGGQKETLTNQNNSLKSNSQRFYVTFPDGTTIEERTQFETYTKALQKIGLDKAEPVAAQKRYSRLNCALIDRVQREEIVNSKGFSYVTIGGYHIVKNILVNTMSDVINNISQVLNLGVQAVITRV